MSAARSGPTTVRVRGGAELAAGRFTAWLEGQGNFALVDNYADGLNGLGDRPIIPDPENAAIYQAYLRYTSQSVTATVGRQEIELDDARFIGNAPIRQNAQNFDALRVKWTGIKDLTVDVSYRPLRTPTLRLALKSAQARKVIACYGSRSALGGSV